jgi:hypothetical protein
MIHIAPPDHYSSPERFVGAIEAARFLGIHSKTLQRFSRAGLVPAHPVGGGIRKSWRYLLSELDLWLRGRSASRPTNSSPSTEVSSMITNPVDFSPRLR